MGLGTCPAAVDVVVPVNEGKEAEEMNEEVALGAIDWGEIFGLAGSCGD